VFHSPCRHVSARMNYRQVTICGVLPVENVVKLGRGDIQRDKDSGVILYSFFLLSRREFRLETNCLLHCQLEARVPPRNALLIDDAC
jgi:hypothetical protein